MASTEYAFLTNWRVAGTAEEVYNVISRAEDLPRWWPSVYLESTVLEPGRSGGIGKRVSLFTKGWLPNTLRWEFVVTEAVRPTRVALRAVGDFVGDGIWQFDQDGGQVAVSREPGT